MSAKSEGHASHFSCISFVSPSRNPIPKRSPFFGAFGPRYMRGPVKLNRSTPALVFVFSVSWLFGILPVFGIVVSVTCSIYIYFLLYAEFFRMLALVVLQDDVAETIRICLIFKRASL